jgi:hypothetical protein
MTERGATNHPATTALFHDWFVADLRVDVAQQSIGPLEHDAVLKTGSCLEIVMHDPSTVATLPIEKFRVPV